MLWYEKNNTSACISTRVRFARNLADVPFPARLDKENLKAVNQQICDAILSCGYKQAQFRVINMDSLGEIEAYAMVERHIISPQFAKQREGRILLLSDDEKISIMIGEEDHLRIQVIGSGECLDEVFSICDELDTLIGQKLKFAFDEKLGFLTECPTNLGTGMRASVMLHLPVLESNGELKAIADAVNKIGLTFRGFYGEGSNAKASIYQLSNQITLGVSEQSAIDNLKNITNQIITKENEALKLIDNAALEDNVYRSFGILKYAKKMTAEEMMKHISLIMLGQRKGVIVLPEELVPIKIFITLQPAMIKRVHGDVTPNERDVLRAESLRNSLKGAELDI